jgi:nitrate reductase delta subunit
VIDPHLYGLLADLFAYPDDSYADSWLGAVAVFRPVDDEVAEALQKFIDETRELSLDELEELYTRTFDLDPSATLDIGWHLWGEAYERGRFLARMRERLVEVGIDEGGELPDHMTSILRFIPHLQEAQRDWWVNQYPLMALEPMLAALERSESPFRHLLAATRTLLRGAHPYHASMNLARLRPVHGELNPDHFDETGTPVGHSMVDPADPSSLLAATRPPSEVNR